MERACHQNYANHAEAANDVTDNILTLYNNVRFHSTLENLPPNAYDQKMADKKTTYLGARKYLTTIDI